MPTARMVGGVSLSLRPRQSLYFVCEQCKLQRLHLARRSFGTSPRTASASSSAQPGQRSESRAGKPLSKFWFAYSPLLSFDRPTSTSTDSNKALNQGVVLSSSTSNGGSSDHKPVDERTVNLGRTIDILQSRIPTLLQSPLPSDILSPSITLHLFPSTHPHLPSISGRVGYVAALWTAPVVWGRLPGGRVRLEVLSERVIGSGVSGQEKLYVKWRAYSANNGDETSASEGGSGSSSSVNQEQEKSNGDEFSGVFIFEFDDKGRIQKHTIENVDSNSNHEHSRVISVTEWLMRKVATRPEEKAVPSLAFERARSPPDKRKHGTTNGSTNK